MSPPPAEHGAAPVGAPRAASEDAPDDALVRDVSETRLLAAFAPALAPSSSALVGPGDDCAVVAAPDGRFVVSTDVLVEDRHFRTRWSSAYDVGWRAAHQNLADVAAMGAVPTALVVSLVLPGHLPVSWVVDLARGLSDACAPWGAGVVGGDLSGGSGVVVAVTAHGDLQGRAPVLRSGAAVGDVVAHAGVRGRSAAGLALLDAGAGLADEAAGDELRGAYLRPRAAVDAGIAAGVAGAHAMIDVSDGLVRDARRVARASGVTLALGSPRAAFADEASLLGQAARALGGADALVEAWLLTGGEDHGMLATFAPGTPLPQGFRPIGAVLPAGAEDVLVDGVPAPGGGGWDHFASGAA